MKRLELLIPPPLVAVIFAAAMWGATFELPALPVDLAVRLLVAGGLATLAAVFAGLGIWAFRRAGTTVNPVAIDRASELVTSGVYGVTRNPMYLGLALLLCAWTAWLSQPWALLGPVAFVAYITRFQIMPEERMLTGKFGEAYARYRAQVRRWV